MEIYLNQKRVDYTLEGEKNLGDVLREMDEWIRTKRELITSVVLDGNPISREEREALAGRAVEEIVSLEVNSQNRYSLAAEGMSLLKSYLPSFVVGSEQIADYLQKGEDLRAYELFEEFIGGLEWIVQMLDNVAMAVELDYRLIIFDGRSIEEHLGDLLKLMREVEGAFENRDMVMLSDLLQYEVPLMFNGWLRMADEIIKEIESKAKLY
jgi:hypothetical protein